MNDLYRYLYAIPGFYRFKIYLLYIMAAILAYIIIMPVITRKKGGIKKCMLFGVLLIFFTGLAFYVNLLINYWVITEPLTNSIDLYGFVPKIKLYKLCDYEYKRGLVEIATYIPIGMILTGWLKKKKTVKICGYVLSASIISELIGNKGKISRFYWPTLFNNYLGSFIGIGLIVVICYIAKKQIKPGKVLCAQIPLIFTMLLYTYLYTLYYTNIWGNVYPEYYQKTDPGKINAVCDIDYFSEQSYERQNCFTQGDIEELSDRLFEMVGEKADSRIDIFQNDELPLISIGAKYEGKKDRNGVYELIKRINCDIFLFCDSIQIKDIYTMENISTGYGEEKAQDILIKLGINIGDNIEKHICGNEVSYRDVTEISDGVFQKKRINIRFADDGKMLYLNMTSFLLWGIINDSGMFRRFDTYQGEDKIVTVKQAYDKLCNGEFYTAMPVDLEEMDEINLKVKEVSMEPERDSRGCLEYVYCFYIEPITTPDGIEMDRVFVPALKNYY